MILVCFFQEAQIAKTRGIGSFNPFSDFHPLEAFNDWLHPDKRSSRNRLHGQKLGAIAANWTGETQALMSAQAKSRFTTRLEVCFWYVYREVAQHGKLRCMRSPLAQRRLRLDSRGSLD